MVQVTASGIADGKFQVGVAGQRKTQAIFIADKLSQAGIRLLQVRRRGWTRLPPGIWPGQMQVATGSVFPVTSHTLAIGE